MDINKNSFNKIDEISNIDELIRDIDSSYLENKSYWYNFYIKFLPNLPLPIQQRIQRIPFRNILSRNRNNPRAQQTTQRLFSLQERVNTQTQTITLNTIENNSIRSREKLDDFIRDWENDRYSIENAINELKNEIRKASKEISNKLDNLNKLLKDLINLINKKGDEIKEVIEKKGDEIKEVIEKNFFETKNILNNINNELNNINNSINKLNNTIIKNLKDEFESLKNYFDLRIETILEAISVLADGITAEFATQFTLIEGTILGVIAAINSNLLLQLSWQTGDLEFTFSGEFLNFKTSLQNTIKNAKNSIEHTINKCSDDIKKFFKDNLKKDIKDALNEWFDNKKSELYKEIVEEISSNIVGESYIKYDSDNLYMPTLIFKYKNENTNEKRRYSQIKLRLNLKPDEITDNVVDYLKIKILALSNTTYNSGNLRCVYVSEKRLFKTTLFTESKEDILNLFSKLMPLTKTNFVKENISYTENSKRNYNIRKKEPLQNTNLNHFEKLIPQKMILNSVFLQINGLDRQVKLY